MNSDDLRRARARWEHALPPLDRTWTHWLLIGGGQHELGVFSADEIAEALKVVENNYDKYFRITAVRVARAPDGSIARQKGTDFEISRLEHENGGAKAEEMKALFTKREGH